MRTHEHAYTAIELYGRIVGRVPAFFRDNMHPLHSLTFNFDYLETPQRSYRIERLNG